MDKTHTTLISALFSLFARTLGSVSESTPLRARSPKTTTTDRRGKRGIITGPSAGYTFNNRGMAQSLKRASRRDWHRAEARGLCANTAEYNRSVLGYDVLTNRAQRRADKKLIVTFG